MEIQHTEFPEHPLPNAPQPSHPETPRVQQPMVFVYEKQRWEYQVITRNTDEGQTLSDETLNTLGENGWELVGIVPLVNAVQFYFKRVRS